MEQEKKNQLTTNIEEFLDNDASENHAVAGQRRSNKRPIIIVIQPHHNCLTISIQNP